MFWSVCLALCRYLINLDCMMTSHSREAKASSMVESDNELGERTVVTRELELCICSFPSKVLTVVELPRSKVFL